MKFTKEEVTGVVVVEIHGKLIGGMENSKTFHDFFDPLFDNGKKWILIDLGGVRLINSQGLGMLIGTLTKAKQAGGELALARVPMGRVREIFLVTELIHVFKIFDTSDEGLKYLVGLGEPGTSSTPSTSAS